MKTLILMVVFAIAGAALSGCATCQNHPYVCAVGGAIVVGSVAATIEAHHHSDSSAPVYAKQSHIN